MADPGSRVIDVGAVPAPVAGTAAASVPPAEAREWTAPTFRPWAWTDTLVLGDWMERDPDLWRQLDFKGEPSRVNLAVQIVALLEEQARGRALLVGLVDDKALVGFAALTRIQPDHTAFAHLAISPDHRGRGVDVGKALVAEAFRLGYVALVAQIRRDNPKAKLFAERVGFGPMPYEFLVIARQ